MKGPIAVTGATGFLGSHVCDVLLDRGHAVRAAHRASSSLRWLKDKPLELCKTDLSDPMAAAALVQQCDGVVHCAGVIMGDDVGYHRVNVDGTRAMLEAAAASGSVQTFVLISSLAAGGPADLRRPRDESMASEPITGYGRSKLAAEEIVAGHWPFRTVVLRPPSLYGPRDREFSPLLRAAARGWTARFGSRMQGLSLVHGRDCAAAAVALLDTTSATGIYHVDDGPGPDGPRDPGRRWQWGYDMDELRTCLTWLFGRSMNRLRIPLGLLRLMSALAGEKGRRRSPVLHPDRLRDLDVRGWVCTAARLRADTRWQPEHNLASGLRSTLEFYRRRGWI